MRARLLNSPGPLKKAMKRLADKNMQSEWGENGAGTMENACICAGMTQTPPGADKNLELSPRVLGRHFLQTFFSNSKCIYFCTVLT